MIGAQQLVARAPPSPPRVTVGSTSVTPRPRPHEVEEEVEDFCDVHPNGDLLLRIRFKGAGVSPFVMGSWVWNNTHSATLANGRRRRTYICLGVLECGSCQKPPRPKARRKDLLAQIAAGCKLCPHEGNGVLSHVPCSAQAVQTEKLDSNFLEFQQDRKSVV